MRIVSSFLAVMALSACPGGGTGGTGGGTSGGLGGTGGGFSSGGGTVSGGGSTQGGGSSGGGSVNGGGTGGSGQQGGALTISSFVFAPKVVAGPDGVFHHVHRTQSPDTIVYGRCAANCATTQGWSFVTIDSANGFLSASRLAVGADNRVHVVYSASGPTRNIYATCASNCTVATSWTKVDLVTDSNCDSEDQGTNLFIDSQGRLTFLNSDFNTSAICVNTCAQGCTTPSNWSTGKILEIRVSGRRINHALALGGTTLHLLYDDLSAGLRYGSCSSNCTQAANWTLSAPLFWHGDTPVSISSTAAGRLLIAFNQGVTDAAAPMEVKAFDHKLLAFTCAGNCGVRGSWNGVSFGSDDDGSTGVSALSDPTGGLVVSTEAAGTRLFLCESGCENGASWQGGELETTAGLLMALPDPYNVLGCTDQNGVEVRAAYAGWNPERPWVAVNQAGGLLISTMTRGLRRCPGLTTSAAFPGYGRLIYAPP